MPTIKPSNLKILLPAVFICLFFALAGESQAADHFFNPNCANNGNGHFPGCGPANGDGAWNNISYLNNHAYAQGDDAYIRDATTISGAQVTPNLNGSASNQAILGSYYNDSGAVGKPQGGAIINGNGTVPPIAEWNNESLVNITAGRSYVTVQDLRVLNSGARGIQFDGGRGNKVLRNYVNGTRGTGIRIGACSRAFLIDSNEITLSSLIKLDVTTSVAAAISIVGNGATGCSSEELGPDSGTVSNNRLFRNHGEGIDVIKGRHNIIVEKNHIINGRGGPNLYLSQNIKNSIARHNLIHNDPSWSYACSQGITVQDEKDFTYAGTEGNLIYGNTVVGCASGVALRTQQVDSSLKDSKIFNNTFIDNLTNIILTDGPYINSSISNNISWITGDRSGCTHATVPTAHDGLTFASNYWSSAPDADGRVSSDPGYPGYSNGDPLLNDSSVNYASINAATITGAEFALTLNSTDLINSGTDQGAYNLLNLANSNFTTFTFRFLDADTYAPWDIGADVYATGATDTTAPAPPSGLSVR